MSYSCDDGNFIVCSMIYLGDYLKKINSKQVRSHLMIEKFDIRAVRKLIKKIRSCVREYLSVNVIM